MKIAGLSKFDYAIKVIQLGRNILSKRSDVWPRVKLHLTNAEVGMWNAEGWKRFAKSFLIQTEYIHSTFDVGRSKFISFFLD